MKKKKGNVTLCKLLVAHLHGNVCLAQEYFEAAARYLNSTAKGPAVTDISGIWLSSDDESVLAEEGGRQG